MQVIVQDLAISYYKTGTGAQTLLCLHGWADTAQTFRQLAHDLPDYTVVAIDLPGFGGSDQPPVAWGVPEYAAVVVAAMQKLGCNQVVAIIGHSNGGTVAQYIVSHQLLPAKKLVLLGTAGIRTTTAQNRHRRGWNIIAKTGKAATIALPHGIRQKLRAKMYAAAGSDLLVAPHMQETFKRVVGYDAQADAAAINIPTLFIHGQADTAVPVADVQRLVSATPHSTLTILPAGHFVHHDQPVQVAQAVREFLR